VADIPGIRESIRRDPRVRITGRPCRICGQNAPVAFIINLRGQVSSQAPICTRCMVHACNELAVHRDVVINVDVERREPGKEIKL
jgi:hypothetical protein